MNDLGRIIDFIVHWGLPSVATLVLLAYALFPLRVPGRRPCDVGFLVSRVAYPLLLYVVLGWRAGGDFGVWVDDHALAVLEWRPPSTPSWYGPLMPLLQGGALALTPGRHPIGVIVPFLVGDVLLYRCGPELARRVFDDAAARWVRWWLLALPLVWHLTVVHAQDEVLFAGVLALALLLLGDGRRLAGTTVLALGFAATKLTFAPYALAAFLVVPDDAHDHDTRELPALVILTGAYGLHWLRGADAFAFTGSVALTNRGVGIPALVEQGVSVPRTVWLALLATALVVAVVACVRLLRRAESLPRILLTVAFVHQILMLGLPYRIASYELQGICLMMIVAWPRRDTAMGRAALVLLVAVSWLTSVSRAPAPLGSPWTIPLYVALNAVFAGFVLSWIGDVARGAAPEPAAG